MRLLKFIRYFQLIKKIKNRIPRYNTETGLRFQWDISPGYYRNVKYDERTGAITERSFVPIPQIRQHAPNALSDVHVYRYNWTKKRVERVRNCRWSF